jgi:hypothetical protein
MKPDAAIVVSDTKAVELDIIAGGRRRDRTGFERVASYRLYGLDGVRKVDSAEWIEADDDSAAIAAAMERFGGGRCEVWQGPRLVARLGGEAGPT